MQTLYALIGVSPDADSETIAAKIDRLEETVDPKSERAKELDFAHLRSVLLDPEERAQYDGMVLDFRSNATTLMGEASWQYISDSVVEPDEERVEEDSFALEDSDEPKREDDTVNYPVLRRYVRTYMGNYGALKWLALHGVYYWLVVQLAAIDFFEKQTFLTMLLAMVMVTLSFFQTYQAIESLVRNGVSRVVTLLASFGWFFWESFAAYHLNFDLPLLRPADRTVLFVVIYPALFFLVFMSAYGLVVHGARKPAIE